MTQANYYDSAIIDSRVQFEEIQKERKQETLREKTVSYSNFESRTQHNVDDFQLHFLCSQSLRQEVKCR